MWDKVYASVRRMDDEDSLPTNLVGKIWEFRIDVVIDGMRWSQVHHLHTADLEANPSVYGWLLDQMVRQLDKAIERGPEKQ